MSKQISRPHIEIDGQKLTSKQVASIARDNIQLKLSPAGRKRADLAHKAIIKIAKKRPVYGQSTGVGSNKESNVTKAESADHGLRLLRSHAAGAGPIVSAELARAMLVVRLNQLAAGGSGVNPALLDHLVKIINTGLVPPITRYGAIGTGDLTALSTTALCILGEQQWLDGTIPPFEMGNTDALAFISSNAATLGEAAVASYDLNQRLSAAITVAALSFMALAGSSEAYDAEVHDARPHPGQILAANEMRRLLGKDIRLPARRIQDSYGLRAFPQVHGPALDAIKRLEDILQVQLNASSENPLVSPSREDIFHNGNFHSLYLTLALDELRVALYSTAALSCARLGSMMEPANTSLRPFLAGGPDASSGVLILEYVAHSVLAELRHLAAPDSLGSAVLSRGTEEHASFAAQASWHTSATVPVYETVLACELVAAVRSLRQQSIRPSKGPLREAYDLVAAVLDPDSNDHPLESDIAAATECLRKF